MARRLLLCVVLLNFAGGLGSAAQPPAEEPVSKEAPAEPMSERLESLARQTTSLEESGSVATIALAKNLAAVLGAAIALFSLVKGVFEFSRQAAQRRSEHFLEMRSRLKENTTFKEICALIEVDDPRLENVPFKEKRDLIGFFEDVALMMNSNLIKPAVAHYMFGYYAIRCWESKHFWSNVNRESQYWALFADFAGEMKRVETSFRYRRRDFKL